MSIKKVVYEQKNTKKWVAEINDFKTPANSHINVVKNKVWEGVFNTKEDAEEAAQKELNRRTGILKRRYAHSGV
jgi:hypothetical protein